ncbi:hypothetical protein BT96DRAFT_1008253 [Gymnopus androsaceus JB14]|uniref:Uncharacterized protein n=1 Tax=Gymnopus androsaceus JB14 TaxID=1447944 RepID=A0A6A4GFA1_9AGAR|nr:hypothetical protein BT96DRAFT_1008253 [Gymnopus androsaceus JB14]
MSDSSNYAPLPSYDEAGNSVDIEQASWKRNCFPLHGFGIIPKPATLHHGAFTEFILQQHAESHLSATTMASSTCSVNVTTRGLEFKAKWAIVGAISGVIVFSFLHLERRSKNDSESKVTGEHIFIPYVLCTLLFNSIVAAIFGLVFHCIIGDVV